MGYDERDPVKRKFEFEFQFGRRSGKPRVSYGMNLNAGRSSFLGGTLLIVFGVLLFLDNLRILPVDVFDAFWPLAFMGAGAYGFFRSCSPTVRVWSATGFVAGLLLVFDAFHVIKVTQDSLWPLILIAIGVTMLVRRPNWAELANRFTVGSNTSTRPIANTISEMALFSGVKRRVETQSFEGGDLSSAFGSIEVDLRKAGISTPGKVAVLEANVAFGAIELRIPETWRLSMQGAAIFGAYEDKTIPPRPEPGVETPTLVVRGGTAFGAVTVKN